jgi:hypothetical protein
LRTCEKIVVCGTQSERIASDFRTTGFHSVMVSTEGHFEDWVQREIVGTDQRDPKLTPLKTGTD